MLEHCQGGCKEAAGKIAQNVCSLFLWRHKYDVSKLHKQNNLHQGSDNWVAVHSLQTQRDGGILDPDDRLYDVADDREQIIANFGEGPGGHGGGDGASSVGTSSPDIFQSCREGVEKGGTDIEVTDEQIASGVPGPLQVRRGSEPALNQILVNGGTNGDSIGGPPPVSGDASKRWSAAPLITESRSSRKEDRDDRWITLEEEDPIALRPPPAFARDGSNRLSIQFFGDNGYRWTDAADKAVLHNRLQSLSLPREHKRREPLGQAHSSPQPSESPRSDSRSEYISLETGGGSLGLHVVPDYDPLGGERGLLVQGVEPGGKVDLDGRLAVGDRVIEINGANLLGQPFSVVQEIFRDSLRCAELRLKVVKGGGGIANMGRSSGKKQGPPTLPKPTTIGLTHERAEPVNMIGSQERCVVGSKVATTRKVPAAGASLQTGNTRKLGKKMEICLTKPDYGLGFSVTSRDNPAGGHAPIYIKNILPKGAAVEDGRLRPGDRLLAVDGVDLTGKTQADAVGMLRNVPLGSSVTLTVSRQHGPSSSTSNGMVTPEMTSSTPSPNITKASDKEQQVNYNTNALKTDETDNAVYPWRQREILTLDIPVHESEKAGLGITVKGKTSSGVQGSQSSTPLDLGIFVKSVIHGGAASRDGRLKTNDQLLSVNGVSLVGESNAEAVSTLRRAFIRSEGPIPGHITLSVARKLHRSDSVSSLLTDSSANTETFGCRLDDSSNGQTTVIETSGNSENSDNTVIFVPPYKAHLENTLAMRNPVVDRLASHNNNLSHHLTNPLRNESYYRATHQTSILLNNGKLVGQTVSSLPQESVIIEDDNTYTNNQQNRINEHEKINNNNNGQQRNSTSSTQTNNDITYASQLSLDEGGGFARDAFGRQSMSEKRHAALDAKSTDTYQRNKRAREERERAFREQRLYRVNSAESVAKSENNNNDPNLKPQLGPALGMKKSSSLESLQTMVQEMQMAEEEGSGGFRNSQSGVRIVRGRGCNESFRAAVDRLDPLAEDEDSPLGRQPSLNTSMESKTSKGKKRPSLLKGIGSMFRFGGKRKDTVSPGNPEDEREAARKAAREEQERIQEQYRRLIIKQHEYQQQHQQSQPQRDKQQLGHPRPGEEDKYSSLPSQEPSRTERINQLRLEHQRRHSERRGHYPLEEREEVYEHHIKQKLENGGEIENAMNRPGSRVGITDASRFSHYVNYHEIQQQLNRRQQHYHSQRAMGREPVHRPVSNFYEYESVQAVLRGDKDGGSLSRRTDHHLSGMNGYNPPGRYSGFGYPTQTNGLPYTQFQARPFKQGPFVTHVTIRETQPKV